MSAAELGVERYFLTSASVELLRVRGQGKLLVLPLSSEYMGQRNPYTRET